MRRVLLATLLSSLTLTAAAATSTTASDASASTSRPVSTGVTSAQLVYKPHISIPAAEIPLSSANPAKVVLAVKLDQTGSPTGINVLQTVSQSIDSRVVQGVRKFRWSPAVLNNHTVPSELILTVEVVR